jgi:predicted restriction endonuclease
MRVRSAISSPGTLEGHAIALAAYPMSLSKQLVRLESLEQWVPFVAEDRAVYQVSRQKRDAAFRAIVLANYGYTCAITG